jgi:hypothetical protein
MLSHGSRRTGDRINSKHEIRNSKQIQMLKGQKTLNEPVLDFKFFPRPFRWERARVRAILFRDLDLFRISIFGFRIFFEYPRG